MSQYSFLKESKLYIEYGGSKYRIHTTTTISFSQTFAEDSYSVKTLHNQSKMFKGSTITKANPAEFNFEVPLTIEKDESIVLDLLTDLVSTAEADIERQQLKSFNLYVQTKSSTYKVEGCAITDGTLEFLPSNQFKLQVSGQGTKLTRLGDGAYSLGTIQSESATRTPLLVYPVASVDSLDMSHIIGLTLQIQNDIAWTPFETLQNSTLVTDASNAMYPTTYTLGDRIVSGVIQQYQVNDTVTQFDDFSTNSNITIKAVQLGKASSDNGFFSININPGMFTTRLETGSIYTQSYDFRSSDNTALGTRITQYS